MMNYLVWEICKFWILQTRILKVDFSSEFERYVNFEFYKLLEKAFILGDGLRDM